MTFFEDVLQGLTSQPKSLPPKYFYDARGSHYFDLICKLDEYYPYRTEMALLPEVAKDLDAYLPEAVAMVEFGAGSLHKVRPLLQHTHAIQAFVPIDISAAHLKNAEVELRKAFPDTEVRSLAADFTRSFTLPQLGADATFASQANAQRLPRLGFFPGSTIGNFTPEEAQSFLTNARQSLGQDSYFLLGVDTQQNEDKLHHAYNDAQGVTAEFNKNLLLRMNRELCTNFAPEHFTHRAHFNPEQSRIEMHLISNLPQSVRLGHHQINFAQGESIHTENSYKYTTERIKSLVEAAGWRIVHQWRANDDAFSEVLLRPIDAKNATDVARNKE